MKINNKKIFYIIIIIIVIAFIFSINRERSYILKEYNNEGKLIGTNECIIKNGDTIANGKFVNYNDKGIKISEGRFINNNIFGKCFYYYNNGKLKSIHYRKNSKITLESNYYFKDKKNKKYIFYNNEGEAKFIINYDSIGAKDYEGIPLIEINDNKNKHLKIGDILKHKYLVANIPDTKRSLKIENLGLDNTKIKRKFKKVAPCQLDVEEVLSKKGKNTIRSIVRYDFKDNIMNPLIDTITFEVEVY